MEIIYEATGYAQDSEACVICGEPIVNADAEYIRAKYHHEPHTHCSLGAFLDGMTYVSPFPFRRHFLKHNTVAETKGTTPRRGTRMLRSRDGSAIRVTGGLE